ncbi:Germin-like protein [Linum perenne]
MSFHLHKFSVLLVAILLRYYSAHAADFCIADLTYQTASGYACKNPSNVTADDFVFTKLTAGGNTTNPNKGAAVIGFVQQFPALNGLGLSIIRADLEPGGAIPLHTHPAATEMIYIVEGTITAGFISGQSNVAFVKKLSKGEVMVFPRGMMHFQVNTGNVHATGIATFSSDEPGVQLVSSALFGNSFPSELVQKTTSIGDAEVKRLKALLSGSG